MIVLDLTGKKYGRLYVVKRVGTSKDGQKTYLCRCDCGNEKVVKSGNLKSGKTKSCGCFNSERIRLANKQKAKHGGCGTRLYGIWIDMRARCNVEKSINWHLYGGRGIKVCEEWQKDFSLFRDWALANGYEEGLQLDRVNNDGNYEPENCKWSTRSEQGNNRRTCKYITIGGITKTVSEWCEETGVNRCTAYNRINRGWLPEKAVTEKAGKIKKLSEEDVLYIKKHYVPRDKEYSAKMLAEKFNVARVTVEAVIEERHWKNIK